MKVRSLQSHDIEKKEKIWERRRGTEMLCENEKITATQNMGLEDNDDESGKKNRRVSDVMVRRELLQLKGKTGRK